MSPNKPFPDLDRKIVDDIFTSHELMDNLLKLCDDFGPRFAGTLEEHKAAEFIAETFVRYGLRNVHLEPFYFDGWSRGSAKLEVIEPISRSINCISLPYCPSGEVEGQLVNLGTGTPKEYQEATKSLKGKFVLTSNHSPRDYGRYIHRLEKYHRSVLEGACGFIWINERPGLGPETGCLTNPAPIPGISIALEDGEFLRRLLQRYKHLRLRLTTTDVNERRTSQNVIADLTGIDNPSKMVILGCHYDSHDIAPGAADSASGMVVVMDISRVLSRYTSNLLKRTIRFVAFGGEEMGMLGSQHYVKAHEDDMDSIRLFFNFDGAGSIMGKKGIMLHHWQDLELYFRNISNGADFSVGNLLFTYSDSLPFFLKGVPTARLREAARPTNRGFGHTFYDTEEKLNLASLREASAIGARVAYHVANADKFPAKRRNQEEVQQIINTDPAFAGYRLRSDSI